MSEIQKGRPYDLEERTFRFAKDVALFCRSIKKDIVTIEHIKQIVRSSGSVGANYIEANESLSKKDFSHRIKIARKEAKETRFWVKLILESGQEVGVHREGERLLGESEELLKILSAIYEKSK